MAALDIDEKSLSYPIPLDTSMYSPEGAFYPAGYQKMVMRVFEEHLERIGMDVPRLIKAYGVSWVLLAMSLEITRPLSPAMQLSATTWHTSDALPLFRREIALKDESGAEVAVGTTFSALFDVHTRRICHDAALLQNFMLPDGETRIEAKSQFATDADFTFVEERRVRPSFIDGVGHVNNMRYGEFVYDALTSEERGRMAKLSRLDVYFTAELKPDTSFVMERAEEGESVIVRGRILPSGKQAFLMRLSF